MARQTTFGVSNISRNTNTIKFGVGGVARNATEGRFGVASVGRKFFPPTPVLGDLPVGTTVKIKVSSKETDFIIVHQGRPSTKYASSCNGTWLMMKDADSARSWATSDATASYDICSVNTYLNGTFLSKLPSAVQSIVKTVQIPYWQWTSPANNSYGSLRTGTSGLSTQVFLLSGYEVGWTTSDNENFPEDGACLDYFSGMSQTDSERICYFNGSAVAWWLRSPRMVPSPIGYSHDAVFYVEKDGSFTHGNYHTSALNRYVRPVFILPSDTSLTDDYLITG